MIEVCRDWDSYARHDAAATRKRMTSKYLWEEIAFERDELNIMAVNRLRRALRPEQLAVINVSSQ
jgi:hypothetical protein